MAGRAKLVLQVAAVGVVALLLALFGKELLQKEQGRGIADAVRAGDMPQAPEFELRRLEGEGTISLASLRGKVVVLNFWASWCEPCKDESPLFERAWQRYRDRGVVFLGVDAQDFQGDARRFVDRYDLTYPMVHDGQGSTLGRFGVTGFPETWFLDRRGRIVEHVVGPVEEAELEENLSRALGAA
jgi:cytochrome c biogenesis protein CcmG/thiol:disulfide interchange protein DsbE